RPPGSPRRPPRPSRSRRKWRQCPLPHGVLLHCWISFMRLRARARSSSGVFCVLEKGMQEHHAPAHDAEDHARDAVARKSAADTTMYDTWYTSRFVTSRGTGGDAPRSASATAGDWFQPSRMVRIPAFMSAWTAIATPSTVMVADDVSGSHRVI